MVRFAAVLVAGLLFPGWAAADTLSPQAFTAAFAAAASAAVPDAKVSVASDLHLETHDAAGGSAATDLHNAYQAYLGDPGHLDAIIHRYVALLADTVHRGGVMLPVDRALIVPVLKPNAWAAGLLQQRKSAPQAVLLTEPYNSELTIAYAEDRPSSVRYLMAGDDIGDRAELHDVAIANLRRLLPKIERAKGADGVSVIQAGGQYEASLLLLKDIWSSGQIKVDGEIVVAVPEKNTLVVTGSHNPAGLARLRKIATDFAKGPYAVTSALLVYRGGKFVVFDGK